MLLLAVTLLGCADSPPQPLDFVEFGTATDKPGGPVELESMVAILARPEDFEGRRVRVQGVLHLELEGDQLCLDKDSVRHIVPKNCIWVGLDPRLQKSCKEISQWNGWYALLEGEISAKDHGHMGLFQASVRDVSHILVIRTERRH